MTPRRELEQRVIDAARGYKSAMVSGRRFDDWCRQMEESIAALDAAPDDDGWQPDRPGWYWAKFLPHAQWEAAEYHGINDGWGGLSPVAIDRVLPPPPREKE